MASCHIASRGKAMWLVIKPLFMRKSFLFLLTDDLCPLRGGCTCKSNWSMQQTDEIQSHSGGRCGSGTKASVFCLTVRVLHLSSLLLLHVYVSGSQHLSLWVRMRTAEEERHSSILKLYCFIVAINLKNLLVLPSECLKNKTTTVCLIASVSVCPLCFHGMCETREEKNQWFGWWHCQRGWPSGSRMQYVQAEVGSRHTFIFQPGVRG